MVSKMFRAVMAVAAMTSVVGMSTVASAESVRPGQSVVSPERAAVAPVQATQARTGATMKEANQAAPVIVTMIIIVLATGAVIYKFVEVATGEFPESP